MKPKLTVQSQFQKTKQLLAPVLFGGLFWVRYHYID